MNAIEVKNLSKSYEYYEKRPGFWGAVRSVLHREKHFKPAVKNISFRIGEGEFVGFIGPNGAGKTTTLKMLSGILHPSGGEARVLGFVPWKREPEFQRQIALVMGNKNQLWWDLPAIDTLLLNKEVYEIPDAEFEKNLEELTALLGIRHLLRIPVRKLSLGERMKAELVAALIHSPKIVFLDEPTIGLDVVSQKALRDFLATWNQVKRATILLTSHYMEDIKQLASRVITIHEGNLIYDGRLEELTRKYVGEKILRIFFKEEVLPGELQRFGKLKLHDKRYVELVVTRAEAGQRIKDLLSALPVDDILVEEVEIEEVVRLIFEKGAVRK